MSADRSRPTVDEITDYARSVVSGEVPAGKYHRLSCARHLRDLERQGASDFPYQFDYARAERFFRFAAKLRHYRGEWAGQLIVLQPHQKFRLGSLFAWVHIKTGLRRFRSSFCLIPRKNGKTLEAAIVSVYATFFCGEAGALGVCAATKRDQAKLVFGDAKQLVVSSGLKSRIRAQVSRLTMDATASVLEPLGADSDSTDGLNPNFINIDEYQAHKTRGLIDVLETATGARREPIIFKIGTAGDDPVSPCGDEFDYACKILDGLVEDETYFAFIAHADPEDDWTTDETARKANPNYGVSVKPDDMRALVRKAINMPSAAATYQQKRLNRWVNADAPWLSVDGWRKGQSHLPAEQFADELLHQSCWVGVDLASQIDLCAMVFVFPPAGERKSWRLLRWVWTPGETLVDRARRDRAPYDVWVQQQQLIAVDGVRINHQVIRDVLKAQRERFRIEQIGFDPWHADQVVDALTDDDGFSKEQVILVPQTYAGMSQAALDFEAAVLEGIVDANGCPLMAWCASNAVVQRDGKDNIYPVKKRSRGRIDPIMASIIGWRLASLGVKTAAPRKRAVARVWTPDGFKPAYEEAHV